MERRTIQAKQEKLSEAAAFVDEYLESLGCPIKTQMQIDLCVEEIFVNIASYAYRDGAGDMAIELDAKDGELTLVFKDSGVPYDPLGKPDPDIALSAEEREIGGLGVFLVKKNMDDVRYSHANGQNILTMKKKIH